MNRLNVSLFIVALLLVIPAQARKLLPVDEAAKDPSFLAFREQLLAAVRSRSLDGVLSLTAPDIQNSFGGDDGVENFLKIWRPQAPDSQLWSTLEEILTMGGRFSQDRQEFWAPYVFSAFPDKLDPFQHLAITGKQVEVRVGPRMSAPVMATLSYEVVKLAEFKAVVEETPKGPHRWLKIITPQGKVGYVAAKQTRRPLDYRAGFRKMDGRWVMAVLVAGD
ncbi:MAG: SH3 domain-containing protein [Deltaproteobacteria bacterium]|nr:SH3 domain-containing protein [Deltaproteobacteria bacterium]